MHLATENFLRSKLKWHKHRIFLLLYDCMHVQFFPYVISTFLTVMIFTFHQSKWQNISFSYITLYFVISWKVECIYPYTIFRDLRKNNRRLWIQRKEKAQFCSAFISWGEKKNPYCPLLFLVKTRLKEIIYTRKSVSFIVTRFLQWHKW